VKQSIEAAAQCYKFTRDHRHPEGEINYRRCLRILGQWDGSDRTACISSNASADVDWLAHFIACLDDREATAELLASIERLKTEMAGPADRPIVQLEDSAEVGTGRSTAPLPLAVALKELNHPLIEGFHENPTGKGGRSPEPAVEWESLAKSADRCGMRGHTATAKIAVGIALAMRYLHSHGIVHCALSPETILVDWDWNVSVGNFTHSLMSGEDPATGNAWRETRSPCRAPECYDDRFLFANDVFSLGMILYRLIVGRAPFPPDLNLLGVGKQIVIDDARPEIPDSVLPPVRELITAY
jgi:hypothetical protein